MPRLPKIQVPKVEPSRRTDIIALCALFVTAGIWFANDRESKGATQKAIEATAAANATLLAQRNRELDNMRADMREIRHEKCDCARDMREESGG